MLNETRGKFDGTEGKVWCSMKQTEKCDVWWNRGENVMLNETEESVMFDGTEGKMWCLMEQRGKCDVWWNRGKSVMEQRETCYVWWNRGKSVMFDGTEEKSF